ncbi:Uncharacterised protein [Mycobacteroides abscessus subsp. abscessus]|nr:Uncharacterised protein [Mycobacteroides abscessus subsp. abscessus]
MLAGVTGTAHPHGQTGERGVGVGHVLHIRWQTQPLQHVRGPGPLHRKHRVVAMLIGDGDPLRRLLLQGRDHGGGIGGVGHQEDLVVGYVVRDEVVNHPAGLGAAQGVLRLAGPNLVEIIGKTRVDEGCRSRSTYQRLAEVTHVEQTDRRAGGGMLSHRSRVRHRHIPAAELGKGCALSGVPIVQWSEQEVRHGVHPSHMVFAPGPHPGWRLIGLH